MGPRAQARLAGAVLGAAALLAACAPAPVREPAHGPAVIGEVEYLTLLPYGRVLEARIDTGATTSSIDAVEPRLYRAEGGSRVRFAIGRGPGRPLALDLPLRRMVRIKRHGMEDELRPVVELRLRMGTQIMQGEFTLADRSRFDYPVLVGRNLLRERFVVDVSRRHLLGVPAP